MRLKVKARKSSKSTYNTFARLNPVVVKSLVSVAIKSAIHEHFENEKEAHSQQSSPRNNNSSWQIESHDFGLAEPVEFLPLKVVVLQEGKDRFVKEKDCNRHGSETSQRLQENDVFYTSYNGGSCVCGA